MQADVKPTLSCDEHGKHRLSTVHRVSTNPANKFPIDFQDTSRRHLKKLSVGFYVVTA